MKPQIVDPLKDLIPTSSKSYLWNNYLINTVMMISQEKVNNNKVIINKIYINIKIMITIVSKIITILTVKVNSKDKIKTILTVEINSNILSLNSNPENIKTHIFLIITQLIKIIKVNSNL